MKRLLVVMLLVFLSVFPACAADTIVIGVSAPLTGDNAEYGEYFRTGSELAVKHINDAGGVEGANLELIIEDSRSDPKEAILIAQRFISNPEVLAVVGDFNSSASMAAAQIYSPSGLVQLSPTASHPDFTKTGEYIFRTGTTQIDEGGFLARWAVNELGNKKIATIYINNDWGVVANQYFADTAKEEGAEILTSESFVPGDKDFTASLTKIKNLNPDMLFIGAQWADAALIATQAEKLGFKTSLMGPGTLSTNNLIENAGSAVDGIRANAIYFVGDTRPIAKRFTDDYNATYGRLPHDHAALTYDSVLLLAEAIKNGGRDRAKIRDALAATDGLEGATGLFRFDPNRNPIKEFVKIQVRDGEWKIAEK